MERAACSARSAWSSCATGSAEDSGERVARDGLEAPAGLVDLRLHGLAESLEKPARCARGRPHAARRARDRPGRRRSRLRACAPRPARALSPEPPPRRGQAGREPDPAGGCAVSSSASARPGSIPSSSTRILARVPVGGERVGLAAGAVEGEHELAAEDAPAAGRRRPATRARRRAPCGGRERGRRRCCSSRAARRSSSRRAISPCANDSYATSVSAGPRQRPRASRRVSAAGQASPRRAAPGPCGIEPLEEAGVDAVGLDVEDVAGRPGQERARRLRRALCGAGRRARAARRARWPAGSSPQRSSSRRSSGTTSFALRSSRASRRR